MKLKRSQLERILAEEITNILLDEQLGVATSGRLPGQGRPRDDGRATERTAAEAGARAQQQAKAPERPGFLDTMRGAYEGSGMADINRNLGRVMDVTDPLSYMGLTRGEIAAVTGREVENPDDPVFASGVVPSLGSVVDLPRRAGSAIRRGLSRLTPTGRVKSTARQLDPQRGQVRVIKPEDEEYAASVHAFMDDLPTERVEDVLPVPGRSERTQAVLDRIKAVREPGEARSRALRTGAGLTAATAGAEAARRAAIPSEDELTGMGAAEREYDENPEQYLQSTGRLASTGPPTDTDLTQQAARSASLGVQRATRQAAERAALAQRQRDLIPKRDYDEFDYLFRESIIDQIVESILKNLKKHES